MGPELSQYENREQAWVKHWLLTKYLEELFFKVGRHWKRIVYIDAFAGPWGTSTTDFSDTSFGRAVDVMRRCQLKLASQEKHVQFEAHFFERDKKRAEQLIAYAEGVSSSVVVVKAYHADFTQQIDALASRLTDKDFAFVLVDPLGYKAVTAPGLLAPLLKKRGVELMVNLMFDHINRFLTAKDQIANMQEIFGPDYEAALSIMPGPRESQIRRLYCQRLREQAKKSRIWSTAFPVEYPDRDRTYYYLVYATHDPTGLLTFGKIAEKAGHEQAKTKSSVAVRKRDEAVGIQDMFGTQNTVVDERFIDEYAIRNAWLGRLPVAGDEIVVNKTLMAEMLEECMCLESDVQQVLAQLIKQGILRNVSCTTKRPKKPVHPENDERIRREL